MTLQQLVDAAAAAIAVNPEVGLREVQIEGPRYGVKTSGPTAAGPGFTFPCAGIHVPDDEGSVYLKIQPGDVPPIAFWGALS